MQHYAGGDDTMKILNVILSSAVFSALAHPAFTFTLQTRAPQLSKPRHESLFSTARYQDTEEKKDDGVIEFPHERLHALEYNSAAQMGFWVPTKVWATKYALRLTAELEEIEKKTGALPDLIPAVQEFKTVCTENSIYRMGINLMIDQANEFVETHLRDIPDIVLDGDVKFIKSFDWLFAMISYIISHSPQFNETEMVGTPLNGLLAVSMGTDAGTALFHDESFNKHFKKVLDAWNEYLKSPESLYLLDPDNADQKGSWISKRAYAAGVWHQMDIPDKTAYGYGFKSWNDFFIRKFVDGARPFPKDPMVAAIGCETTPWQYQNNVQLTSDFWIKGAKYSLSDMFGDDECANYFVGGQVYQGFLSATHYHRWNCPVDGKLIRAYNLPGTYFAQRPGQGENEGTWEGTDSQPYLTNVATRAVFVFDTKSMGKVALICVGMVEVSTCVMDYHVGKDDPPIRLKFGEEIGHFEFGGSTHCMIFEKDKAILADWAVNAVDHRNDKHPVKLGSVIAKPARGTLVP